MKKIRRLWAVIICASMIFSGQSMEVFGSTADNLIDQQVLEGTENHSDTDISGMEDGTEAEDESYVVNETLIEEESNISTDNAEDAILQEVDDVNDAEVKESGEKTQDNAACEGLLNAATVKKNSAYIKLFNWNGTGVVTDMKWHKMYWKCEENGEKIYADDVTDAGIFIFDDFYGDFNEDVFAGNRKDWDLYIDYINPVNNQLKYTVKYDGTRVNGRTLSCTNPSSQFVCDAFFSAKSLAEYNPENDGLYSNTKWHKFFTGYVDGKDDFGENHSNEMIYCACIEEPWEVEWYDTDGTKLVHWISLGIETKNNNIVYTEGAGGNLIIRDLFCDRHACKPVYRGERFAALEGTYLDDATYKGTIDSKLEPDALFYNKSLPNSEPISYRTTYWNYVNSCAVDNYSDIYTISPDLINEYPVRWYECDQCLVSYNKNGGNGDLEYDIVAVAKGISITMQDYSNLTREGYKCVGWCNNKEGTGKVYKKGEKVPITQHIDFYAKWEKVKGHYVIYDPNGGEGEPIKEFYEEGKSVTIKKGNIFKREGYRFIGWKDATGNFYEENKIIKEGLSKDLKLFSTWEKIYKVYYRENGGEGKTPEDNKEYKTGDTVTIQWPEKNSLKKGDEEFAGWVVEYPDGQKRYYKGIDQTITIKNSDVTFYAWYSKPFDCWGFDNNRPYIGTSTRYAISNQDYNRLKSIPELDELDLSAIDKFFLNTTWAGSCHGMSGSAARINMGLDAIEDYNLKSGTSKLGNVSSAGLYESVINFYAVQQKLCEYEVLEHDHIQMGAAACMKELDELAKNASATEPILITERFANSKKLKGHTVVGVGRRKLDENENMYKRGYTKCIMTYDPADHTGANNAYSNDNIYYNDKTWEFYVPGWEPEYNINLVYGTKDIAKNLPIDYKTGTYNRTEYVHPTKGIYSGSLTLTIDNEAVEFDGAEIENNTSDYEFYVLSETIGGDSSERYKVYLPDCNKYIVEGKKIDYELHTNDHIICANAPNGGIATLNMSGEANIVSENAGDMSLEVVDNEASGSVPSRVLIEAEGVKELSEKKQAGGIVVDADDFSTLKITTENDSVICRPNGDSILVKEEGDAIEIYEDRDNDGNYEKKIETDTDWTDTTSLPTESGSYVLQNDVRLSDCWQVNADITLDLNGHTVDRGLTQPTENGSVISINNGSTLTLTDSSPKKKGVITGGSDNFGVGSGIYVSYGNLVMTGGKISGNNGGGVHLNQDCTFNMSGGEISGNTAKFGSAVHTWGEFKMSGDAKISGNRSANLTGNAVCIEPYGNFIMDGGMICDNEVKGVHDTGKFTLNDGEISGNKDNGVHVKDQGTFIMTGGKISGNTAEYGAGVDVTAGIFNMSGGEISGNTARFGAGVHAWGEFNMTGGTISGNTATEQGSNIVCIESDSNFTMDGGTICDNEGTGVFNGGNFTLNNGTIKNNAGRGVDVHTGKFTMTGGSIAGNVTDYDGGGVCVCGGTFDMSGNSSITGNSARDGGGVYILDFKNDERFSDGIMNMSGNSSITGNTATTGCGGGVYTYNGTLTMNGGSITGNSSANYMSGGVYCGNSSTFNMSGSPVVRGNYRGGTLTADGIYTGGVPADIDIQDKELAISVTGPLTGNADIYVCGRENEYAAQGTGGYNLTAGDVAKFKSNYWYCGVVLKDGKAYIEKNTKLAVVGQKINLRSLFDEKLEISRFVVDNNKLAGISKDTLTGKKPGIVKVTAQKQTGKNQYENVGECEINILNKPQLKFTKSMTYIGQKMNATNFFVTEDIRTIGATYWESAKPGVVEVKDSENGILKACGNGSAKITAYFGEKGKAGTLAVSSTINVKIPSFQKSEYKMLTGSKLTLNMKNVTAASDPDWVAAKDGIIRVKAQTDRNGKKTGKVILEGLAYGDTKLIATIDGQKYECTVYVAKPGISKAEMGLKVGQTGTLTMKNTSFKKQDITWKSENEKIAKVDATGKVTGVAAGNTIIYTETGGFRNECAVTVVKPVINKAEMELKVNKTGQLSLKNCNIKKQDIIWKSKNPKIATVDANGKVKAVAAGSTVIYTDAGGVRNECVVTVK